MSEGTLANVEDPPTRRSGPELSIVIPAYNEDATVAEVIRDHAAACARLGVAWEILVLDDGSTDATASELGRLPGSVPNIRILVHQQNLGIGRSLLDLYRAAEGTWVFFNAADGQVPASELALMWDARRGAALVVGRRTPRRDPLHRVAFGAVYSALMRGLFGVTVRDVHSVKLYRAEDLQRSWPSSTSSFAEDEILIALTRANAIIREVPIAHRPRRAGQAHGGSLRIALGAISDLLIFAVTRRPRQPRDQERPRAGRPAGRS